MTSGWPRFWLCVAGVLVLGNCRDSTPSAADKALVTLHVEGMTERLELF